MNADTIQREFSLFSFFKVFVAHFDFGFRYDFDEVLVIYKPVAAILFAPILFLAYRTRTELWKSVTALVVAAILLPQLSGHYKLIYLLIPIVLFVAAAQRVGLMRSISLCLAYSLFQSHTLC